MADPFAQIQWRDDTIENEEKLRKEREESGYYIKQDIDKRLEEMNAIQQSIAARDERRLNTGIEKPSYRQMIQSSFVDPFGFGTAMEAMGDLEMDAGTWISDQAAKAGVRINPFAAGIAVGIVNPVSIPGMPALKYADDVGSLRNIARAPGSPFRAGGGVRMRKGDVRPPFSKIFTETRAIKAIAPHMAKEADQWIRDAYIYARKNAASKTPLKGFRRFVTDDGVVFQPKPNQSFGEGYSLKAQRMDLKKEYAHLRLSREKGWTNPKAQKEIFKALKKRGLGDRLPDLLDIMESEYKAAVKGLGKKSKGHIISLNDKGLDIAENIQPENLRSLKVKTNDGFKIQSGNASMQARSTLAGADLIQSKKIPTNWEEYINLKINQNSW